MLLPHLPIEPPLEIGIVLCLDVTIVLINALLEFARIDAYLLGQFIQGVPLNCKLFLVIFNRSSYDGYLCS